MLKTIFHNTLKMKQKAYLLIASIVTLISLTCCSREDDINQIFENKTWYMNGGMINGMRLNSEIKNFYTDAGDNAYKISFSGNAFQCVLSEGTTINGTWSADGGDHTISFVLSNKDDVTKAFDKQIYNILTKAKSYTSGSDFLYIKQDGSNIIYLGPSRSKVYN